MFILITLLFFNPEAFSSLKFEHTETPVLDLSIYNPEYSFDVSSSFRLGPKNIFEDCEQPEMSGEIPTELKDTFHIFSIAADGRKIVIPLDQAIDSPLTDEKSGAQ